MRLLRRAYTFLMRPRVYAAVAVVTGLLMMADAFPRLRAVYRRTPWDLNVDHLSARAYLQGYSSFTPEGAIRSGVSIAGVSGQGHPPTTSFWALPLAPFEIHTAGHLLGALTLVLIFIQALVLARQMALPVPWATAWVIWCYIASCGFMAYHLGVGQWSGLIGFLFFAAWWAGRSGRDVISGVAIGLACTLKLFPGVMLVFLLAMRRWRAIAAAAAAYLAVAVLMTARFGIFGWRRFFAVQTQLADRWLADIQNQSIHGVMLRLFQPVCRPHGPVIPAAVAISGLVAAILVGTAALWAGRRSRVRETFDLTFALFVTLAVVTSQWTWEHYAVIYLLPALLLLGTLRSVDSQTSPRMKRISMVLLACVAGAWRIPLLIKSDFQKRVFQGNWKAHVPLHVFDALNWLPGLVLLALLVAACRNSSKQTAPADSLPQPGKEAL